MQLSCKQKIFSNFFVQFLKTTLYFEDFDQKMIVMATLFWKVQTVKNLVRPLSKKHRLRTPFDSQQVKVSQTLVNPG